MKNTDFFVPNALDYLENQGTITAIDIELHTLKYLLEETDIELYNFI